MKWWRVPRSYYHKQTCLVWNNTLQDISVLIIIAVVRYKPFNQLQPLPCSSPASKKAEGFGRRRRQTVSKAYNIILNVLLFVVPWVFINNAFLPCTNSDRLSPNGSLCVAETKDFQVSWRKRQSRRLSPLLVFPNRRYEGRKLTCSFVPIKSSVWNILIHLCMIKNNAMHECTNRLQLLQPCLFGRYTHSHPRKVSL